MQICQRERAVVEFSSDDHFLEYVEAMTATIVSGVRPQLTAIPDWGATKLSRLFHEHIPPVARGPVSTEVKGITTSSYLHDQLSAYCGSHNN